MAGGWDIAIAVLAAGVVVRPALTRAGGRMARDRAGQGGARPGSETSAEGLCWCNGFVARLLFWATRNCH